MAKSLLQSRSEQEKQKKANMFPLRDGSYRLIIIGIAIIMIGFVLMMGGGADTPDEFNYDIFSFRRITLAPIIVLAGFAFICWVILRKPLDKK